MNKNSPSKITFPIHTFTYQVLPSNFDTNNNNSIHTYATLDIRIEKKIYNHIWFQSVRKNEKNEKILQENQLKYVHVRWMTPVFQAIISSIEETIQEKYSRISVS